MTPDRGSTPEHCMFIIGSPISRCQGSVCAFRRLRLQEFCMAAALQHSLAYEGDVVPRHKHSCFVGRMSEETLAEALSSTHSMPVVQPALSWPWTVVGPLQLCRCTAPPRMPTWLSLR